MKILCLVTRHFFILLRKDKRHIVVLQKVVCCPPCSEVGPAFAFVKVTKRRTMMRLALL